VELAIEKKEKKKEVVKRAFWCKKSHYINGKKKNIR